MDFGPHCASHIGTSSRACWLQQTGCNSWCFAGEGSVIIVDSLQMSSLPHSDIVGGHWIYQFETVSSSLEVSFRFIQSPLTHSSSLLFLSLPPAHPRMTSLRTGGELALMVFLPPTSNPLLYWSLEFVFILWIVLCNNQLWTHSYWLTHTLGCKVSTLQLLHQMPSAAYSGPLSTLTLLETLRAFWVSYMCSLWGNSVLVWIGLCRCPHCWCCSTVATS